MKYLGKKKMYQKAVEMLGYSDMPKCVYCRYKYSRGFEWLEFSTDMYYVKFSVMNCGSWVRVVERNEELIVVRDDVIYSLYKAKENKYE